MLKGWNKMSKRILVIGDTHVGDIHSIMPPNVKLYSEENGTQTTVQQNDIQKFFYSKWLEMCNEGHFDAVICLGDMCDGSNYKDNGRESWTTDLDVQTDVAAELLNMIDADKFFNVYGSPYHNGKDYMCDKTVMDKVDGNFNVTQTLNIEDLRFYCKHTVGVSKRLNTRGSSFGGDIVNMIADEESFGKIDVQLRGHAHYFYYQEIDGVLGMVAPCWKSRDSFLKRGDSIVNDCGYIIFNVEDDNYSFEKHLFRVPQEIAFRGTTV